MHIKVGAMSDEAYALVRAMLAGSVGPPILREDTVAALIAPTAHLVAGLLHAAARSSKTWLPLGSERQLDMLATTMIAVRSGYATMAPQQDAVRVRATNAFLLLAGSFGVRTENWRAHFGKARVSGRSAMGPVTVHRAERGHNAVLHVREPIAIDGDEDLAIHGEQVRLITELTGYLLGQGIVPPALRALRRTFFREDGMPLGWDLGGRISAAGSDNFQGQPLEQRLRMTINGRQVIEIDMAASGLTIAQAAEGMPLDPHLDPYAIDEFPRQIVKAFVVEKFGPRGLPFVWRHTIARDLGYPNIAALEAAFPAKRIWRAVRARYPILKGPIDWAKIQHLESEIILGVVRRLAFEHDIPALPVHDSIIVPVDGEVLSARIFTETCEQILFCSPRLVAAALDPVSGAVVRELVGQPVAAIADVA